MHARSGHLISKTAEAKNAPPIRVMVIDDSLTVRTIFSRMVEAEHDMVVAGTFSNAERALVKLRDLKPDVILLDLEMPGMGGLEALPRILALATRAHVLVVSSLTQDGAEHTLAALSIGAADTMLKPRPGGFDNSYQANLLEKIRALGSTEVETPPVSSARARLAKTPQRAAPRRTPDVIAIGASTGGIHALSSIVKLLPKALDVPMLVTQHLPPSFVPVFARQLETASGRRTTVAETGMIVKRNEILVAPGDGHMLVMRKGDQLVIEIGTFPVDNGCMPSVDPMLETLAEAVDGRALAVILSGMGRDGVKGAGKLAQSGGNVYAQDAESSAVWGMPGSVAKAGLASLVGPPEVLAEKISTLAEVSAWR